MAKVKPKNPDDIIIRGARLVFPNFAGRPTKFNKDGGKRTVGVVIEDLELASKLESDGWRVKYFKPNPDTGEIDASYLVAKISYVNKAPKIVMVSSSGKQTRLDEESVGILDIADVVRDSAKVHITPYVYDGVNGGAPGVSAYIRTLYVTIEEDVFEKDFEDEDDDGDYDDGDLEV